MVRIQKKELTPFRPKIHGPWVLCQQGDVSICLQVESQCLMIIVHTLFMANLSFKILVAKKTETRLLQKSDIKSVLN